MPTILVTETCYLVALEEVSENQEVPKLTRRWFKEAKQQVFVTKTANGQHIRDFWEIRSAE